MMGTSNRSDLIFLFHYLISIGDKYPREECIRLALYTYSINRSIFSMHL